MPSHLRFAAPRNVFRTVDDGGASNLGRGGSTEGSGVPPSQSFGEKPKVRFVGGDAVLPPTEVPTDADRYTGGVKAFSPVYSRAPDVSQIGEKCFDGNRGPQRLANAALRLREYLTAREVETLISEARKGRYGHRDAVLILVAYRHGLRASEIADLEWSQVELGRSPTLHVRRVKNGKPSAHPLRGDEVRALRELRRQFPDSSFVFATERGGPFTPDAVNRLIKRIGERAGLPSVHAHMLRHGCGYALANAGHDTRAIQDWLGHRSIQHTVRYAELSPTRFRDFWRD